MLYGTNRFSIGRLYSSSIRHSLSSLHWPMLKEEIQQQQEKGSGLNGAKRPHLTSCTLTSDWAQLDRLGLPSQALEGLPF